MTESSGWGDDSGELEPDHEHVPGSINLGSGLVLHIDQRKLRALMTGRKAQAQVDARGRAMAAAANAEAITKNAQYVYVPSTHQDTNTRARGRVMTGNYHAQVDSAQHSTLIKSLAQFPSDAKPGEHGGEAGEEVTT